MVHVYAEMAIMVLSSLSPVTPAKKPFAPLDVHPSLSYVLPSCLNQMFMYQSDQWVGFNRGFYKMALMFVGLLTLLAGTVQLALGAYVFDKVWTVLFLPSPIRQRVRSVQHAGSFLGALNSSRFNRLNADLLFCWSGSGKLRVNVFCMDTWTISSLPHPAVYCEFTIIQVWTLAGDHRPLLTAFVRKAPRPITSVYGLRSAA